MNDKQEFTDAAQHAEAIQALDRLDASALAGPATHWPEDADTIRDALTAAGASNTLRQQLQQQCTDWGIYWRAPDAHGVSPTLGQATELLALALGVEVEIVETDQTIKAGVYDMLAEAVESVGVEVPSIGDYVLGLIRAAQTAAAVPEGYTQVPSKMYVSSEQWDVAQSAFGGPGTDADGPFLDCTLWVGEIDNDDGSKTHGLHVSCDDCPEEGSITLSEFAAAPQPQSAKVHDPRTNGATEPCDAPNGEYACSCGAWHPAPAGRGEVVAFRMHRRSRPTGEWMTPLSTWQDGIPEKALVAECDADPWHRIEYAYSAAPVADAEALKPGDRVVWRSMYGAEFPATVTKVNKVDPATYVSAALDDGTSVNGFRLEDFRRLTGADHG